MDSLHKKPLLKVVIATCILLVSSILFTKLVIEKGALRTLYMSKKIELVIHLGMVSSTCDIFYNLKESSILKESEAIERTLKEVNNIRTNKRGAFQVWIIERSSKKNLISLNNKYIGNYESIYSNIKSNSPVNEKLEYYTDSGQTVYHNTLYKVYNNWDWIIGVYNDDNLINEISIDVKRRIWSHFVVNFTMLSSMLIFIILTTYQEEKKLRDANTKLDISQKKLEQAYFKERDELVKTKKHFIEAEKMIILASLVRSFTHDISTPIGGCKTVLSDLVYRNNELDNKIKNNRLKKSELSGFISNATESLKIAVHNIDIAVSQIYSFKRIAIDQQSENKESINISDFIKKLIISAAPFLNRGNYRCNFECSPDIEIITKPGSLSQVILNLIINSIIHGFKNKSDGTITISVTEESDKVIIKYLDDGKGISDDIEHKVWEPFFTTEKANGGTGLGLYNVKNLVADHLEGALSYIKCDGFAVGITLPKK